MDPHSTHQPFVSGAIAVVTDNLIVDTGQRDVQTYNATLGAAPSATEAIVGAVLLDEPTRPTRRLRLYVRAADGTTAGVNPVAVAWWALGK